MIGEKTKSRKVFYIIVALTAVISLVIFIKTGDLRELENSASKIRLKTGQEVSRRSYNSGTALGKPIYAELILEYKPLNNYTKTDLYNEIISMLEKNNWKRDAVNVVPDYYSGSLIGGYNNNFIQELVGVLIVSDSNLVKVWFTHR